MCRYSNNMVLKEIWKNSLNSMISASAQSYLRDCSSVQKQCDRLGFSRYTLFASPSVYFPAPYWLPLLTLFSLSYHTTLRSIFCTLYTRLFKAEGLISLLSRGYLPAWLLDCWLSYRLMTLDHYPFYAQSAVFKVIALYLAFQGINALYFPRTSS